MNIYYAPPEQIRDGLAELRGQEAKHASAVMRACEGDEITIVDGKGGTYEGTIRQVLDNTIQIGVNDQQQIPKPKPELILAMGIIKKRDRLEFAVEKAVELGACQIVLFRGERSIKKNVRIGRLESIILAAMKQSMHPWLPELSMEHSLAEVLSRFPRARPLMAHEKVEGKASGIADRNNNDPKLLLVGPEGGFSPAEVQTAEKAGADLISLGKYRLRAETAAVTLMSQFI